VEHQKHQKPTKYNKKTLQNQTQNEHPTQANTNNNLYIAKRKTQLNHKQIESNSKPKRHNQNPKLTQIPNHPKATHKQNISRTT